MNIQGKVWGHTKCLFSKNNVEIHEVHIVKGGFCSKHKHSTKYNRFIVKRGQLKITIWKSYANETLEDVTVLNPNMECTVAPQDYHMFEALEDTEALEIYYTELDSDDIVRETHGGSSCHEPNKHYVITSGNALPTKSVEHYAIFRKS